MLDGPARARALCLAAAASVAVSVGLAAAASPAAALVQNLQTFPVSVDVKLKLTERSTWKGIRDGCYAPAENFDMTYELTIDSRPNGKKSKVRVGTATLTGGSFGATASYGDRGSFRQFSAPSPWELETQDPAGCGSDPPPAPPSWATSPTCRHISEQVSAILGRTSGDNAGDGTLILVRTPKPTTATRGAGIGDSCYRTLHNITAQGIDSEITIGLRETVVSVPLPKFAHKLRGLTEGSGRARPSFRVPITVGGDCLAMHMTPSTGAHPDFTRAPFSQPHEALGPFNGDAAQTPCTISGSGRVVVRREGAVVDTAIPLRLR